MSVNKVRTAVVGCGMISNIYIRNLSKLFKIIDLVAICDIIPEAAAEKAALHGIPRIMTLEEIASSEEIELVVNLTGPTAHYDVIKMMLNAGKHVYTEKMFTTDIEKSRELVRLADEKGLYLGVAPDTVLGAGTQTAKRVLELGLIGQVTSGQVCINRNQLLNSELFRFLKNDGGALPYDVGIYYIGTLLTLLGPVKAVRAFGAPSMVHEPVLLFANESDEPWQIPGNNVLAAALEFENGALVSVLFDGNTINAEQHAMTIFGTEGILKVGNPEKFGSPLRLIRQEAGECDIPFTHGYDGRNMLDEKAFFDDYGNRGIGVAEMAWAIRKGRTNNRCSKEYGLHCQEVLYGMDLSAKTGETYYPESRFVMEGLRSGCYSSMFGGAARGDAERSLMD
ncbi:MAG: Gfo/Idh/MocA family oxidoreductase [Lachnospiraceae bacterium]|nr:Gfo/Idh/MocA family oxidoreductase [Lachnospiraceae bacterium]